MRCISIHGCFVSVLCLLSSVRRSVPSWTIHSLGSSLLCLWVLVSLFPWVYGSFGSKVSLSDEVARWDESILFLLPLRLLLRLSSQFLLVVPWVLSFTVSGVLSLPSSFASVRSALSLSLVGVVHSAFLCFSFRYAFLVQLAFCRTLSTRVNYQEQWTVYHEWCRRLGHTVSRPSIPTVAHFFFASFAVSLFFLHRLLLLDVDCGVSLCSSCLVLSLCSSCFSPLFPPGTPFSIFSCASLGYLGCSRVSASSSVCAFVLGFATCLHA